MVEQFVMPDGFDSSQYSVLRIEGKPYIIKQVKGVWHSYDSTGKLVSSADRTMSDLVKTLMSIS